VIAPARLAAYRTLLAVDAGTADLADALARARTSLDDERDRALAGEIAVGTLRWQGAFDHVIALFAKRPVSRLDPEVLTILRMSAFQLLHLDRVPAAAIVDDAVELARKAGKTSAAGFVNALLRRVSRESDRLPLPPAPTSSSPRAAMLDYLSITLSHPRWLMERWLDRDGYEAALAWARFNNEPAALTLRANTLTTTRTALAAQLQAYAVVTEPARFASDGLIVRSGNPLLTSIARDGLFVVQDEASQLVGAVVGAAEGQVVFDACASPGGKTTQMAAAMKNTGLIVAADVRGRRVDLLARTIAESTATCIDMIRADAREPLPFRDGVFDIALVDAPCSGLGTIRRDPDIRWRRQEADLSELASRQAQMLDQAARVLKSGGHLIYATCSSEPEENDDVVRQFLSGHPEFAVDPPPAFAGDPVLATTLEGPGFLRTLPFRHGLEAFFAARLVKARGLR
jgi:16S rRNA (cytosine967-C5)-methyltransferase